MSPAKGKVKARDEEEKDKTSVAKMLHKRRPGTRLNGRLYRKTQTVSSGA